MKINIIWGKYVVYDYGQVNIAGFIGETSIDIKNESGAVVSELVIDTTNRTIIKLPTLSTNATYDIEIDDGSVVSQTQLPSEDPSAERDGIKISHLQSTSHLEPGDIFALSRDDGQDGSYDRTLHVTLADLIAAIQPAAAYTLTVNSTDGGEVFPSSPENHQAGESVVAGINMDPAYNFLSWTSDWSNLNGSTDTNLNFQMPAQNVTLTPNVELADPSEWDSVLHQSKDPPPGEGWGGWDPNDSKYTNGETKTTNPEDSLYFYHSEGTTTYTSILTITNEYDWFLSEILAGNYANLQLDYIDENDSIVNTLAGDPMSYTDQGLLEQYFGPQDPYLAPKKLGIQNASDNPTVTIGETAPEAPSIGDIWFNDVADELKVWNGSWVHSKKYLSMQFDQPYSNIRARITKLDTQETVISSKFYVYSDSDPVFGRGV